MIKKYLSFTLCCLLLVTANSALLSAQSRTGSDAASAAKIKAVVAKRGTGEKKRVKVKMLDGTKLKGYISQAGEDSFTLTDSKTAQSNTIAYRDVAEVRRGGGFSKTEFIALGVIAVAAVVVVGYFTAICSNEGTC